MSEITEIPGSIGVMALPGCVLFPEALLPLYIFEPRYRKMLSAALAGDRCFAVAQTVRGQSEEVHQVAGAGIIRACITNEDGTSHLILQGVARICFESWKQTSPYRIGKARQLVITNTYPTGSEALRKKILTLCRRLKKHGMEMKKDMENYVNNLRDDGQFCDLLAHFLIPDSTVRQSLLEECDVGKRLLLLTAALQQLTDQI